MLRRKKRTLTDEEIVKIIVETKSHDDFGILYDRYAEKVFHKCISFVKNRDEAEDLAHDIFLKTFVNLSKFNFQAKFSTWLYRLTYNFCIDYLRKNNKVRLKGDDQILNIPDDDDDQHERELLQLKAEHLGKVLDRIAPEDKALLLMKYQDDISVKDLAASEEVSESAIKMRLKRARAKAVELYRKTYGDG